MTTTAPAPTSPTTSHAGRAPALGLLVAVALIALAMAVPQLTGWRVHVSAFPPLHADWDPRTGPGTVPAVVVAALAAWQAIALAERLPWRGLLAASYAGGLAWMLSLAFVDGSAGIGTILDTPYEYLRTARAMHDFPHALATWVAHIAGDGLAPGVPLWVPHVAGHPPGALTFFLVLVRLGLGSGFAAGMVVVLIAATTAPAVMITLHTLGAQQVARRAAPFLVLGPAAVWQAVSADAVFSAVAAWGIVALALAAVRRSTGWSLLAGVLLGWTVMLSYGLLLIAILALTVLVVTRTWKPLAWAVLGALAVVGVYTAYGFHYWEALPALHKRQYAGIASVRPAAYWMWGNYAVLMLSAGPVLGAGLACLRRTTRTITPEARRVLLWLVSAGVAMTLAADASQASKGEVERIWLPFVPWLLVSTALLPARWRRLGLGVQLVTALAVQHLFATGW